MIVWESYLKKIYYNFLFLVSFVGVIKLCRWVFLDGKYYISLYKI